MIKLTLKVLLGIILAAVAVQSGEPVQSPVQEGLIILTLEPDMNLEVPREGAERCGVLELDDFLDDIQATWIERTFPYCTPPKSEAGDLTVLWTVKFPRSFSVSEVCKLGASVKGVRFAEPSYIYRTFLQHNDPQRNNQYGLDLCRANEAHDISTGDRGTPVAIVDTGMDMDHSDLVNKVWINPGEDLNEDGVIGNNERNNQDDDNNGYNDDFYGWDFMTSDNNPNDTWGHGTHCAGIAAAETNNRIGVASVGYDCSIMVVRAGSEGTINFGYQGIEYAARMGAKVISCSWGGDGHNNWSVRVINNAWDNGALIVAAAGNQNADHINYPAGDNHVIAVAATDERDRRAGFSNYGNWVDISAPGVNILSTYVGNRYAYLDGTSMACPFAASVAVLIRAAFPHLDPDQAAALLLEGADPIDDVNRQYAGRLGSGRIDAFRSLQLGIRPLLAVESLDIITDDNNNELLDPGESASIAVTISNGQLGEPAENMRVTLLTADPKITIREAAINFPDLENGSLYSNSDTPFHIQITDDAIPHTTWFTVLVTADPGDVILEKVFEVIIGHPDILIVDDDDAGDQERFYFESLAEINQGWVRWDVCQNFAPGSDILGAYDMTIWLTGNANPPLDDLDRWQIQDGLTAGANIILIGKYIGDDADNRDFLLNYFGARHDRDSVFATTAEGIPGDNPLADDVQLLLVGGGEAGDARQSPSTMVPTRGADTLAMYMRSGEEQGIAAVYWQNPRNRAKTIYMGFTFEAVNNRETPRSEALRQIYNWIEGITETPLVDYPEPLTFSLNPAYPNPFNSFTKLEFSIPLKGSYGLTINDLSGRQITSLAEGEFTAGHYQFIWNSAGSPSGLYLARLYCPGHAAMERTLVLIK